MFDEGELRRDLAALLRDNREEVAERLERGYVEAYPRSRANFMAASAIHQWTLDEIENLAQVVESGDCSMRTYRGQYGDAVEDPHNPELTAFASYIAANLFEARQMAPFLFQRGGGKGIRLVERPEDMERAFQTASSEAEKAFGDGRMYMEKYLDPVKHIEVQLLADEEGNIVCLGERECSIQRNNQKLIEESPSPAVTPELRSRAKAVNFGIVYGQQAFGLSQTLDIPVAEAREMIDRYFEAYPGVRTYLDETVAEAKERGFAETMLGRKRHIPELKSSNGQQRAFGERTAMNHPMQGTAADIIKIAMARVSRRLEEEGFAAHMILQVHDELDFECPVDEVERLTAMVQDAMEHVVDLRVPLIAEASTGITWADAK